MNQGRCKEKILLSIGLILIFSSSSTSIIDEFEYLTDYIFRLGGFIILIATISSLTKKEISMNKKLNVLTYIYGSFISLVILSIIINQNLETEIDSLEKFILTYLFLGVSLTLTDVISKKIIIKSFIISSLIIFIYFLIKYPISEITSTAYKGGFVNPNSIGVLAVTLFSVCLVAGISLIQMKQQYFLGPFYLIVAIGAGYLVMISNSRTAFITLVVVLVIVSIAFIYDKLKKRNILSWESITITAVLALIGTSLFILIDNPVYAILESTILDKFVKQTENIGLTAGRTELWKPIIEEAGFFGKGSGYFSEMSDGLGAHNSFLHILSLYGWFAAIAYVVFWFVMLIKSVGYYLSEKLTNVYALLPLIIIVNFISISMMENMTVHVSAFLAISMIAIFSVRNEKNPPYKTKS